MDQKLVKAITKLLKDSHWSSKSKLVIVQEEHSDSPEKNVEYILSGTVTVQEALALKCWTPDEMREKCEELSDKYSVEVSSFLDFAIQCSPSLKVLDLEDQASSRKLFKVDCPTLILCWTSFFEGTAEALEALMEFHSSCTSNLHVVSLVMDEDPTEAKKLATGLPIDSLWVGPEGWSSQVALSLSHDDPAPTAFLFDVSGENIAFGSLEDILDENLKPNGELLEDQVLSSNFDVTEERRVPRAVWEEVKRRIQNLGEIYASLRSTTAASPISKDDNAAGLVREEIVFEGRLFLEDVRIELEELNRYLVKENSVLVKWGNVELLTKPRLPQLSKCSSCGAIEKLKFACLVCENESVCFCEKCGLNSSPTHPENHPLLIFDKRSELNKAVFGLGDVIIQSPPIKQKGKHFDIGCNACLAMVVDGNRYKNLVHEELDLCEPCYKRFVSSDDAEFVCELEDPFCLMKNSLGVDFRMKLVEFPPSKKSVNGNSKPKDLSVPVVPSGHTTFSWNGGNETVPAGHTSFSWGA